MNNFVLTIGSKIILKKDLEGVSGSRKMSKHLESIDGQEELKNKILKLKILPEKTVLKVFKFNIKKTGTKYITFTVSLPGIKKNVRLDINVETLNGGTLDYDIISL